MSTLIEEDDWFIDLSSPNSDIPVVDFIPTSWYKDPQNDKNDKPPEIRETPLKSMTIVDNEDEDMPTLLPPDPNYESDDSSIDSEESEVLNDLEDINLPPNTTPYRSPFDSPPLKDLPYVTTVDEDDQFAEHLRGDRHKLKIDRLATGFELEGEPLGPEDMIGRSILMPPTHIGERFRGKIISCIDDL
jgi:hypothetical protein